jgi:hypothetical protein
MSDDSENKQPEENVKPTEQPATPKPAAKKPVIKASGNPFLGQAGNFNKGKSGSNGFKGKIFKGSGVKKGK